MSIAFIFINIIKDFLYTCKISQLFQYRQEWKTDLHKKGLPLTVPPYLCDCFHGHQQELLPSSGCFVGFRLRLVMSVSASGSVTSSRVVPNS